MQNVIRGKTNAQNFENSDAFSQFGFRLYNNPFINLVNEIHIFSCYICRMLESADAIDDSDDEVDYTKMDQGNKKGPVGRWDFDTQEEYSDYMSNKEALPK